MESEGDTKNADDRTDADGRCASNLLAVAELPERMSLFACLIIMFKCSVEQNYEQRRSCCTLLLGVSG